MTMPMGPNPHDSKVGPREERFQELGNQIVTRISALIRVGASYGATNTVFRTQLDLFKESVRPLLEESGEAVFVALDTDLFLNGVRIPVKRSSFKFQQSLIAEFKQRRIAGVRVIAGAPDDEYARFFHLFLQKDGKQGRELLEACQELGVVHINPVVRASTEMVSQSGGSAGPADVEFDVVESAGGGGDATSSSSNWGGGSSGANAGSHAAAVAGARVLLGAARPNELDVRRAKRVVQPLVDDSIMNEPVVVGLTSLGKHDEYTYAHAVNVCSVAVHIGQSLGLDRKALADLGVASLFHDVGKAAVEDKIHHPLESFTPEEHAAAARHPVEGAKIILKTTRLNPTTLRAARVALEHHCGPVGRGYPRLPNGARISLLSKIVQIADCYVSLLMHRSERGRNVTPYDALSIVLGTLRYRFDLALRDALVHAVGYYPTGQLVEMDDGTRAVVIARNPNDLARPHIRVLYAADSTPLPEELAYDLRPCPSTRSIRRALRAEEYPGEVQMPGGESEAA